MANYTMTLLDVVYMVAGNEMVLGNNLDEKIEKAIPIIFNFDFPIFDETHRGTLEKKIIKHYLLREISMETFPLWRVCLDTKLNEIMPYYNDLFSTTLYKFNPENNVSMKTVTAGSGNKTGEHSGNSSTTENKNVNYTSNYENSINSNDSVTVSSTGKTTNDLQNKVVGSGTTDTTTSESTQTLESDFPQATFNDIGQFGTKGTKGEGESSAKTENTSTSTETKTGNVSETKNEAKESEKSETDKGSKADVITENSETSNTDNSNFSENTTNENTTETVGNDGRYTLAYLLKEYRETLMNIDLMIIKDLETLFMSIW